MTTFYDFNPKDNDGSTYPLSKLRGKIVLVVNTASNCGFATQFEGLEKLYQDLQSQHPGDFEILAFPCNQFANLEPNTNTEIKLSCQNKYGVSFPVLGKTDVNGDNVEPVWEWMKQCKSGICGLKFVKWNFEKFLIGRDGMVKGRWASVTKPEGIKRAIMAELGGGWAGMKK